MYRRLVLSSLGLLLLSQALRAAPLVVSSVPPTAIPAEGNVRITASVPPGSTVSAARVYFNAEGKKPEYYLEMVRGDGGFFWAMLPVPKPETKNVLYRIVFSDGAGRPSETRSVTVPVKGSVKEPPSETEMRYARNLVIGVTDANAPLMPEGFECIGIVSSINVRGELKPNEVCRTVVIPAALWVAAGTAAATAGVIILSDSGEPPTDPPPPPVSPASAPASPVR